MSIRDLYAKELQLTESVDSTNQPSAGTLAQEILRQAFHSVESLRAASKTPRRYRHLHDEETHEESLSKEDKQIQVSLTYTSTREVGTMAVPVLSDILCQTDETNEVMETSHESTRSADKPPYRQLMRCRLSTELSEWRVKAEALERQLEAVRLDHDQRLQSVIAEHQDLGSRQQTLVDKLNRALRDSLEENEKVRLIYEMNHFSLSSLMNTSNSMMMKGEDMMLR